MSPMLLYGLSPGVEILVGASGVRGSKGVAALARASRDAALDGREVGGLKRETAELLFRRGKLLERLSDALAACWLVAIACFQNQLLAAASAAFATSPGRHSSFVTV